MLALCKWLAHTAVGASMRESVWLFPVIETMHLLGMAALVGTVGVFDLRLLGWVMRPERVSELERRLLPWAWVGFAVQVVIGTLLFSPEAIKVYTNPAFRLKMLLILLAGVQALVSIEPSTELWRVGEKSRPPVRRSRAACRSCYGLASLRRDVLSVSCDFAPMDPPGCDPQRSLGICIIPNQTSAFVFGDARC